MHGMFGDACGSTLAANVRRSLSAVYERRSTMEGLGMHHASGPDLQVGGGFLTDFRKTPARTVSAVSRPPLMTYHSSGRFFVGKERRSTRSSALTMSSTWII